jgi:hypothetical protein
MTSRTESSSSTMRIRGGTGGMASTASDSRRIGLQKANPTRFFEVDGRLDGYPGVGKAPLAAQQGGKRLG